MCAFYQVLLAETVGKHYTLVQSDETIQELTGWCYARSITECASYCSTNEDCFTFVYGAHTCWQTRLWLREGELHTPVPKPGFTIYSGECLQFILRLFVIGLFTVGTTAVKLGSRSTNKQIEINDVR